MRFLVRWSAVIMALVALAGCNSNDKVARQTNAQGTANAASRTGPQPASNDGARRVTTVELEDALNKGEAIVVDVRNDAAYKQGHVKGALLIPVSEVAQRINELPRDKMIVTYCS
jgi:3-mercaptopyruvate sulfurtransferase SseA